MDRDDRDDPFGDLFEEIERMMNQMANANGDHADDAGFGTETHVDTYVEDDTVRLVADLPGVSKDDLSLQCDGETLTVSAASDRREYDERIDLPVRVDERSASATFNNGILEVTFDRADDSASIDVS
ncbi:Hsp20/alpha crystallin family protein [Halopenitus persicus]|uniref:HSP20 family protein n=1 Tax=Halopenitus persicus TaxID=1048396 RepID=A0A1H3FQC8_9EURY|nr:Hsp20/alpha crystallin family protein [Halopenitus persicus]QHS16747.1 Hsp20/alpha crystallin family protein [haloarchaeon 3A1-DGR]SDX93085.1 HSP20 family protein [Halopenitus persicus]